MPGQPCANHPHEITLVRCGRCEKPICVACMVDTPVGKKCGDCARNRTHLSVSTPQQVIRAFAGAAAVAIPAGWLAHQLPSILIGAIIYGYLVAEVALRAGSRSRSLAVQAATGTAALIGSLAGSGMALHPWALIWTALGVAVAVSRVRFL